MSSKHSKKSKMAEQSKLSKSQKSQVKKLVRGMQQLKFFNVSAGSQLIDWAGAVVPLSNPTQGNGDTQRNGDTIKSTSLQISYNIRNPAVVAPGLEQVVRVIIFRWLPIDTVAPVLGDIMNATGTAVSIFTQYNDDRRDQFEVLYDKSHKVTSEQLGASGIGSAVYQHYVKCNKKIEFNAGTTIGIGKIYMLYVSDMDPAIGASRAQMSYLTTFRYTNS